jgi:cytochrome P450
MAVPAAASSTLARLLLDPASRIDPYPLYAELRAGPPAFTEQPLRCFALATYRDVSAALQDPRLFSSTAMRTADPTLLGADPPRHTRVKKLMSRAFTPARVASLQATIRAESAAGVKRMLRAGTADVMAELAHPLPLAVLRALLALGRDDESALVDGAAVVMAQGGERPLGADNEVARRLGQLDLFLTRIVEARRRRPGADIISAMLQPDPSGDALTPDEAKHLVRLLLAAAIETTSNLIGNTVLALLHFPGELARVRDDRSLVRGAVLETLRLDAPVQVLRRVVTAKVTVGGTPIAAGDDVLLLLGSANRDPDRFERADHFDVSRAKRDHLAFGAGVHACVGASLALAEAVGAIEALLTGARTLRAVESPNEIPRTAGLHVRGVQRLIVECGR